MFREDWEDSEHYLFTHKQGKNIRNLKKTTILRVKDLRGSVVKENIVPLANPLRYIAPLMHVVMGLGNDLYDELTRLVKDLDEKENRNQNREYKEKI